MVSWYAMMMLASESSGVIGLRLLKLAGGGNDAMDEAHLMISEKVDAAIEATTTLVSGGSLALVVDRYREHVAQTATDFFRPSGLTYKRPNRAA